MHLHADEVITVTSTQDACRQALRRSEWNRRATASLPTRAPFHFEATARVLQRRPSNLVDVWNDGRYFRTLALGDSLTLVEVENHGTIDAPDVRYYVRSGDTSAAVTATLRRILGLDVDPAVLQQLARTDVSLGPAVHALRGMRPPRFTSLFESFLNVIPFQQLSLGAGVAIVVRLTQAFGGQIEYCERRYYASPSAHMIAAVRLDRLRACGLSVKKSTTLRNLARKIDLGEIREEEIAAMSTREALRTLTALPGIGPWSAALILLRGLGRLDVFPPGDTGAARGLGALLQLDRLTPLDRVVERFGEHRGYLYFCGLGASLLARGLIHAAPPARR
jgi:3-methyladenine DNA glycosylase/8-oxoguanine DNA glycosylase